MKKNGKKYRTLQKEKERRQEKRMALNITIEQEVDEINISRLSVSRILIKNPILKEKDEVKKNYVATLEKYIKLGQWNRRKCEDAELMAYKKIILESKEASNVHDISYFKYYILLDVMHILGYDIKKSDEVKINSIIEEYYQDFADAEVDRKLVDKLISSFKGQNKEKRVRSLMKNCDLEKERPYIELILKNLIFMEKKPEGILVTATMSAGKSTFINALTGKYISLSQNMACTSKIHSIVNKAFDDGYSYEYDHDLVLMAGSEELLNDNESNESDKIVVGTYFNGYLRDQRIIINDSPGVNFSGNTEHKEITDKLIRRKNYHLLIYLMNATQPETNDESEHLDFVKKTIGRTPVIFVINKIDALDVDEENIIDFVNRRVQFLKQKGFKNPIVCPVSSRAGYLSKKYMHDSFSKAEERELYNFVDKFNEMNIPSYYESTFKKITMCDFDKEEIQLQKTSGLAYVEKIIQLLTTGGRINGTN